MGLGEAFENGCTVRAQLETQVPPVGEPRPLQPESAIMANRSTGPCRRASPALRQQAMQACDGERRPRCQGLDPSGCVAGCSGICLAVAGCGRPCGYSFAHEFQAASAALWCSPPGRFPTTYGKLLLTQRWNICTSSLSLPAEHPAESLGYEIRSGAKHCGHAGLRLYRDASGKVFPNILVFRYDDVEQPFEWMGHAFSERDEQYDRLQEIAPLAKSARDPNFFERLDANSRLELTKDIPGCS